MKVQETGFVEFVTDLIGGTIDAVISSQLDQEKKYIELKQDLLLSKEDFILKYDLINVAKNILGENVKKEELDSYINDYINNHKDILKQYFNKNALKVIVDRGKVNAKLIFSFTDDDNDEKEVEKPKPKRETIPKFESKKKHSKKGMFTVNTPADRVIYSKINKSIFEHKNLKIRDHLLKGKRMVVKPVDANNKDMLDLKTDIVSNVEFSFRTIVE